MKKALITGVTGPDGAYLSRLLLSKGYQVVGVTRQISTVSKLKLAYLGIADGVDLEECDLLDLSGVTHLIEKHSPDECYNLAAQSSVAASFDQPIETIQFNLISVLNLLQAIKVARPRTRFYQASSSEIYGKVAELPVNESAIVHPLSPYAISKAAAHWAVVNYREAFGLFACSGILFNHESFLRPPNFFVKKVITEAVRIRRGAQSHLRVGNIDVRRDFGYAPDYVEAMWRMLQLDEGRDFLVCSGRSMSLREIILHVFNRLDINPDRIVIDKALYRPAEILDMYGDNSRAKDLLDWSYDRPFLEVLDLLINEELDPLKPLDALPFGQ